MYTNCDSLMITPASFFKDIFQGHILDNSVHTSLTVNDYTCVLPQRYLLDLHFQGHTLDNSVHTTTANDHTCDLACVTSEFECS